MISPKINDANSTLKILNISNSHGEDAVFLLYDVLKNEMPSREFFIAECYFSGALTEHVENAKENREVYKYTYWTDNERQTLDGINNPSAYFTEEERLYALAHQKLCSIEYALKKEKWDIIMFNESCRHLGLESIMEKGLIDWFINYIYSIIDYKPTLLFETTWSNPTDDVMYTDPSRQTAPASFRDTYLRNYGYNRVNHYNKMMELTKKYVLPNPAFDLVIDTATPIQYATEVLGVPLSSTDRVFDAYRDYTHISDCARVIAAYAIYTQLFGIKELTEIKTPGVNAFDRPTYREISLGDLIFTDKHKKVILESVNHTLKHPFEL